MAMAQENADVVMLRASERLSHCGVGMFTRSHYHQKVDNDLGVFSGGRSTGLATSVISIRDLRRVSSLTHGCHSERKG